jgi:hypothetical protein
VIHVARWFLDIGPTRGGSPVGPNPITYQEIEAYQRLMGLKMLAWEVAAIRDMDDAVLIEVRKAMNPKGG